MQPFFFFFFENKLQHHRGLASSNRALFAFFVAIQGKAGALTMEVGRRPG